MECDAPDLFRSILIIIKPVLQIYLKYFYLKPSSKSRKITVIVASASFAYLSNCL